jgi:hypothetical protein
MRAAAKQERSDIRLVGTPVDDYVKVADCFPFKYPDVIIQLAEGHNTAENQQALVEQGGFVTIIREKKFFVFASPTSDDLKFIMGKKINPICACNNDQLNVKSLLDFRRSVFIFSAFFRTHSYPAYRDPEHHQDAYDFALEQAQESSKRKRDEHEVGDENTHVSKKAVAEDGSQGYVVTAGFTSYKDTVMKVKSPPRYLDKSDAWVGRNHLSGTWGLFAPYFSETQHYDSKMVPSVIRQYFSSCLGHTKNEIAKGYDDLCRSWGNIGNTESGKILTHMAFCISVGLPSQARILPIFEGDRYYGCVLSGYGFVVGMGDERFTPVDPEQLKKDIGRVSTHQNVLGKVLVAAGYDLDDAMGEGQALLENTKLTALGLREALLGLKMTDDQRNNVAKFAKALDFGHAYRPVNHDTINSAFNLIKMPIDAWPRDSPIHPSVLMSRDAVELAWSTFGFSAPTFRPIPGRAHKIFRKTYEQLAGGKKAGTDPEKKVMKFDTLYVRDVVLSQAVADLRALRDTKEVNLLSSVRRSGKNMDRVFEGTSFTTIVAAMRAFCGVVEGEEAPDVEPTGAAVTASIDLDDW